MTKTQHYDIVRVIQEVLWNASNYPERVQSAILGEDISGLAHKTAVAVSEFLGIEVPESPPGVDN